MNTTTYTQVTFEEVIAKDLKKELAAYGIKVLMCRQGNRVCANTCIEGSLENFAKFEQFAKENGYVNSMAKPHVNRAKEDQRYIDLYGVFKVGSKKSFIVK